MPELPEVETIRRFLEPLITSLAITRLQVLHPKSFTGDPRRAEGQTISKLTRLGKQLTLHLSNDLCLHFHLKMTGQLVYSNHFLGHPTPNLLQVPNSSTRLVFTLSDNSKLYFNDQRLFGWVKLLNHSELAGIHTTLGIDILDPQFNLDYFSSRLTSRKAIKLVLLDQSLFAGIGNIYANDSLFIAGIHPATPANHLSSAQIDRLHQAIVSIINEAIIHQGSTAADDSYILPDGSSGSHQYHFRVYQRAGESCPTCHTPIIRIALGGRGTFYCPNCQKPKPVDQLVISNL